MGNEGAVMEAIKLEKRGSSSSIRGGGTLGGEEEGGAVSLTFPFFHSLSFKKVKVLS